MTNENKAERGEESNDRDGDVRWIMITPDRVERIFNEDLEGTRYVNGDMNGAPAFHVETPRGLDIIALAKLKGSGNTASLDLRIQGGCLEVIGEDGRLKHAYAAGSWIEFYPHSRED